MEANVLAQAFALIRYGDFTLAVTETLKSSGEIRRARSMA
jgi:hypothetical protein